MSSTLPVIQRRLLRLNRLYTSGFEIICTAVHCSVTFTKALSNTHCDTGSTEYYPAQIWRRYIRWRSTAAATRMTALTTAATLTTALYQQHDDDLDNSTRWRSTAAATMTTAPTAAASIQDSSLNPHTNVGTSHGRRSTEDSTETRAPGE